MRDASVNLKHFRVGTVLGRIRLLTETSFVIRHPDCTYSHHVASCIVSVCSHYQHVQIRSKLYQDL